MNPAEKPLTPKQEAFCQHYVLHNDAYKAYRAAYNAHNTDVSGTKANACNLLKNPRVSQRIAQLQGRTKRIASEAVQEATAIERRQPVEESNLEFEISAHRVLQELAIIGFANMADYVTVDEKGNPTPNFTSVTRRQFAAIGEITIEDIETGQRTGKRTKFKLLDKRAALVDLGRHLGLFKDDKQQAGNTVNINVISDAAADFDRRMVELAARVVADEVARSDESAGQGAPAIPLGVLGTAGTA